MGFLPQLVLKLSLDGIKITFKEMPILADYELCHLVQLVVLVIIAQLGGVDRTIEVIARQLVEISHIDIVVFVFLKVVKVFWALGGCHNRRKFK